MQIVMVSHYCTPHIGGVESISLLQSQILSQRGHKVTIISSRVKDELSSEVLNGVRIIRIPVLNILEEFLGIPYPIFYLSIIRTMDEEISNSDVCIIHSFGFMSSFVAAWVCLKNKIPYVVIQNNQYVNYRNIFLNKIQHLNDITAGKFILKYANQVLAVSLKTCEYARYLIQRKVEILNNPVDVHVFYPSTNKYLERLELKLPKDKFIVLTCGRLVYKRSIETLIRAAYLLLNDTRFFFVVVGDGPEKGRLDKIIQTNQITNCLLIGAIPHELVNRFYRVSDIFVLTSQEGEGWPVTVLEAWASELPVITTPVGGPDELIESGQNGFVIDCCAPEQIVSILLSYISKPDVLHQMGKQGKEIVLNKFTIESHIEQLENSLENAVSRSSNC